MMINTLTNGEPWWIFDDVWLISEELFISHKTLEGEGKKKGWRFDFLHALDSTMGYWNGYLGWK